MNFDIQHSLFRLSTTNWSILRYKRLITQSPNILITQKIMEIKHHHNWNVSIDEARKIQLDLKEKIKLSQLTERVTLVAGADVSYSKKTGMCFAAVSVFNFPEMKLVEQCHAIGPVTFSYIPGYLTFREAPILLEAFEKIINIPDVILFDGQGIAHPRMMGLAAHLGLILDLPSIGCAKSRLVGEFKEPTTQAGSQTELIYKNQRIGAVVRTRKNVKPVFVSPGFKITIEQAVDWVLKTCTGYRIPEPIRISHLKVNQIRAKYEN